MMRRLLFHTFTAVVATMVLAAHFFLCCMVLGRRAACVYAAVQCAVYLWTAWHLIRAPVADG